MTGKFFLEIVIPDRKFFSDDVEMLIIDTPDGEMGVMRNHMPLVTAVSIGTVRILQKNGEWCEAFISEGFMEVRQNKAIIVADTAEWPDEIDINRAMAAEERARERLQRHLSHMDYTRTQAALQRSLSRLKVKGKR
ncbi:MAG: F0F1 ATP synthase subunit epsilon [Clostridia bacterium]|nr:F0F1 ATP synthase subunit epsilon [Clostridia bacterium]